MSADHSPNRPHHSAGVRLVADLPTGSFAFVMATGIISIAAALLGFARFASVLLTVNAVAFLLLWVLTLLRGVYCSSAVIADLCNHRRGPGFLTVAAGTNVFGRQIAQLTPHQDIAASLWLLGGMLWVGLVYSLFAAFVTRAAKPLLFVVAPESSAILGAQIAGSFSSPVFVIFISLSLCLLGGAFYLVIITLILYRWLFEPMTPSEFTPAYWINMGGAAITALAAARLSMAVATDPALAGISGFLLGTTLFFWTVASWWIPLLALMGWRHLIGRLRLVYQFDYWSLVFPLAMYAVATLSVTRVISAEFLTCVLGFFFWAAIGAWSLTFFGMIRQFVGLGRFALSGRPKSGRGPSDQ
jgi:tellurite resistance protein TehA-like permease